MAFNTSSQQAVRILNRIRPILESTEQKSFADMFLAATDETIPVAEQTDELQ
jgi:hypothetical protein